MENGPADTLVYMYAGFAVIFGVILLYLGSLLLRFHNLHQDQALLDEVEAAKNG